MQLIYNLILDRNESTALSVSDIWKKVQKKHHIEVSRKTIQRDVVELTESHKILSVGEAPIRYFAGSSFKPDYVLSLNEEVLLVILIALENLKSNGHEYFDDKCKEAEVSIFSKLPQNLKATLEKSKSSLRFSTGTIGKAVSSDLQSFEKVMTALRQNQCFECRNLSPYKSEEYNEKKRKFAPLVFSMADQVPYLIAEDLDDGVLKRLRITRLVDVKLLKDVVNKNRLKELKNLSTSIGGWGGKDEDVIFLKITCNEKVASFFREREIHISQKIEKQNRNTHLVTMEVAASNEISRFLAGLGEGIKKVEPDFIWYEVISIWRKGLLKVS